MSKWSVKKPFTVFVGVVLIIVLGIVAFGNMTPDLLPNIELPYVVVVTSYVGASPQEVELNVTKPIEQQMATLDNIDSITSTSSENSSFIIMTFTDDANMDSVTIDVREKLDLVSASFDDYVGTPYILKLNPDVIPVTVAAIDMGGLSPAELTTLNEEQLMMKFEGIEGVARVTVSGGVSETIMVEFDQEKIDQLNEQIADAIHDQFGSAKGAIYSGLNAANMASSVLSSGQVEAAQSQAANQFATARLGLQNGKQQLQTLVQAAPLITGINTGVAEARNGQQQIYDYHAALPENAGKTPEEIQAICNADPAYTAINDTLAWLDSQLGKYGFSLNSLPEAMETVATADEKLKLIDNSLAQLDVQESALNQKIAGEYATAVTLAASATQLRAGLEQIESTEQAFIDATNLTGIVTVDNLASILSAQNFSMPAGYAYDENARCLVNVGDKITDMAELESLILFDLGIEGIEPIRMTDVADTYIADNADSVYAKIDGAHGLLLSFTKQSGYATATVSENIQTAFEELQLEYENMNITSLMDQGDYIDIVVGSVLENLVYGAVLAVIVLILFLRDFRPTLITAVSIPVSVTFAVVLMYFSGITLNVISLSGLAVGVGMLVDNSIVVIENIYRLRKMGYSAVQAAISGAAQVAGAITSSTLTTVCVFFPIVFVQGLTRQLFTDMALTITYSLLASLVIALTLVPAMASTMLERTAKRNQRQQGEDGKFMKSYKNVLNFSIDHKAMVLVASVVLLVVSVLLGMSRGFEFMPDMPSSQLMVTVDLPEDTEFETTAEVIDELSVAFSGVEGVQTVGAMMSSGMAEIVGLSTGGADNTSSVTMYVITEENKSVINRVTNELTAIAENYDIEMSVSGMTGMSSISTLAGDGITINVYANELDDLANAAEIIGAAIANVEGIAEVDNGIGETAPEIKITVDKNKAMASGLTVAQVYMDIATLLTDSKTATALAYEQGSRDVVIKGDAQAVVTLDELREHIIITKDMQGNRVEVPLADIAAISMGESLQSIGRSEQRRTLSVTGYLQEGYNVTLVASAVMDALNQVELPAGVLYESTGENETIMTAMQDLGLMLLLGVAIVYLIMVAQFQSLLSPFIVMFTIPLSFTGGMLALLICGMRVSIVAMIGFIMLVGIIVNNGIVLIDYINLLRREGMERREAIVNSCVTRLRPVLMTALTTILGLLPMALGIGSGSDLMQPIAVVCIGGLLYATVMTLVVIPVMYDIMCKKELRKIADRELEVVQD